MSKYIWSYKKPTQQGYYWYRKCTWFSAKMKYIEDRQGTLTMDGYGLHYHENNLAQWAGPIEYPVDKVEDENAPTSDKL